MFYPANVASALGLVRISVIVLAAFLLTVLPVAVFGLSLRRFLFLISPFAVLAPIEIGYVRDYGVNLAFGSAAALYETSLRESLEYLGAHLIEIMATPLVVAAYYYIAARKVGDLRLGPYGRIVLGAGVVVLFGILAIREGTVLRHKLPFDRLPAVALEKIVDQVVMKTYPVGSVMNLYASTAIEGRVSRQGEPTCRVRVRRPQPIRSWGWGSRGPGPGRGGPIRELGDQRLRQRHVAQASQDRGPHFVLRRRKPGHALRCSPYPSCSREPL